MSKNSAPSPEAPAMTQLVIKNNASRELLLRIAHQVEQGRNLGSFAKRDHAGRTMPAQFVANEIMNICGSKSGNKNDEVFSTPNGFKDSEIARRVCGYLLGSLGEEGYASNSDVETALTKLEPVYGRSDFIKAKIDLRAALWDAMNEAGLTPMGSEENAAYLKAIELAKKPHSGKPAAADESGANIVVNLSMPGLRLYLQAMAAAMTPRQQGKAGPRAGSPAATAPSFEAQRAMLILLCGEKEGNGIKEPLGFANCEEASRAAGFLLGALGVKNYPKATELSMAAMAAQKPTNFTPEKAIAGLKKAFKVAGIEPMTQEEYAATRPTLQNRREADLTRR